MNYSVIKYILTVVLCYSCNLSQAITKNIKEYHLNGKVYCIGVKKYSFYREFGEIKRGKQISEHYTYFLQNGNVYVDSLVPNKKYKRYFYDNKNNLTKEICIISGAGRKIQISNSDYHYNDTVNYVMYQYDYKANGSINEIKKYVKNQEGSLMQTRRFVYSRTNDGERIVIYTRSGIDSEEITNGNIKTTKIYSGINDYKSPVHVYRKYLNKNNLPTKMSVGGLSEGEISYTYDEHNNVIKETIKTGSVLGHSETKIITWKYEYDKNGNWVRQLEFKNGELKSWTERVIYYANSASDYTKIVEQEKQVSEKHKRIMIRERQYEDSIATRKKFNEDFFDDYNESSKNNNKSTIVQNSDNSKIYNAVEYPPQFPGGYGKLMEYLSNAIRYPVDAEAGGVQGRVECTFVVETDGSISNIKVIRGVAPSLDKEAIRVLSCMPKWIPGKGLGAPVRVRMTVPVTFKLQ